MSRRNLFTRLREHRLVLIACVIAVALPVSALTATTQAGRDRARDHDEQDDERDDQQDEERDGVKRGRGHHDPCEAKPRRGGRGSSEKDEREEKRGREGEPCPGGGMGGAIGQRLRTNASVDSGAFLAA